MHRLWVLVAVLSVIGVVSCHSADSKAAIQSAVEEHLHHNSHLMLNSFTTQFQKITRSGDTARALVKYQSKNLPNVAVEVSYGLKRINGQWQVISSSSSSGQMTNPGNPHQNLDQETTPPSSGSGAPGPIASH
ncbi:MAG: hypothetical protein ACRD1O_09210 [Terriglobia bacterium]